MMETPKVGPRIVDVQDDNIRVTINRGSIQGVNIGQRYILYRVTEKTLVDPDTKEDLGKLEIPLGTGKVIYVQDKVATIESDMLLPPLNRVIKKFPGQKFNLFGSISTQEITETPAPDLKPFDDPVEGDYAKPI